MIEWAKESPYLTFFLALAFFEVLSAFFKAMGGKYQPLCACLACRKSEEE